MEGKFKFGDTKQAIFPTKNYTWVIFNCRRQLHAPQPLVWGTDKPPKTVHMTGSRHWWLHVGGPSWSTNHSNSQYLSNEIDKIQDPRRPLWMSSITFGDISSQTHVNMMHNSLALGSPEGLNDKSTTCTVSPVDDMLSRLPSLQPCLYDTRIEKGHFQSSPLLFCRLVTQFPNRAVSIKANL